MSFKTDKLKIIKLTLNYTNSKFLALLLLAIIPSILISFSISPYSSLHFLRTYGSQDFSSFATVFLGVFGLTRASWISLFGFIFIPALLSVIMGAVERHMRIGEFNLGLNRLSSRLNFNFRTAFIFASILFIIFVLDKFLQAAVFLLFSKIFEHTAAFALSIIWYLIMATLELFILAMIILWVPTMLHTGLTSSKAFELAVRQNKDHFFEVVLGLLIPTVPSFLIMVIVAVIGSSFAPLFDSITIAILMVYYIILMYTLYFDVNGLEREDLKKVDIWKIKTF